MNKTSKRLFLSAVSREFGSYREELAVRLSRPNVEVKTQEEFLVSGGTTLEKLDDYIKNCDAVVHLVGDATGSIPPPVEVKKLSAKYPDLVKELPVLAPALSQPNPGISYTQWEVYLAIYHDRKVFIYRPTADAPRGQNFQTDPAEQEAQAMHYINLCKLGRDRGQFDDVKDLSSHVLRDLLDILAHDNRQSNILLSWAANNIRKLAATCDRKLHAWHCKMRPSSAWLGDSEAAWWYWGAVVLRFIVVFQAILVLWNFYFQLDDGSLHGVQQAIFLYVAFVCNLFVLSWRRFPRRCSQLVRMGTNRVWRNQPHKFAASSVDLALIPLELTCVLATVPATIERWMNDIEPTGRELGLAMIIGCQAFLVGTQIVRYWPVYRHGCRAVWRMDPPAVTLAVNWLVGCWFLFNPLLLPTGAEAKFQTAGSVVTHLAADSDSQELAAASHGEHVSSQQNVATTIEIVEFPGMRLQPASFEGLPWLGDSLRSLVFHHRLLTYERGDILDSAFNHEFGIWPREGTWRRANVIPNLGNMQGQGAVLDSAGRVILYGRAQKAIDEKEGQRDQTSQLLSFSGGEFTIAIATAPNEPLVWVNSPWISSLIILETIALSPDGTRMAVAGTYRPEQQPKESTEQELPQIENPYIDEPTGTSVALFDVATGAVIWQQPLASAGIGIFSSPRTNLAFSPDGERLLKSEHEFLWNSTTHSLIQVTDGAVSRQFQTEAGEIIWSPDNIHLALRRERVLEVYSAHSGELARTFRVPRGRYTVHTFSKDGKYLVGGGDQGWIWSYRILPD